MRHTEPPRIANSVGTSTASAQSGGGSSEHDVTSPLYTIVTLQYPGCNARYWRPIDTDTRNVADNWSMVSAAAHGVAPVAEAVPDGMAQNATVCIRDLIKVWASRTAAQCHALSRKFRDTFMTVETGTRPKHARGGAGC